MINAKLTEKSTKRFRKNSCHDLALKALANSGKPMTVAEITQAILKTKKMSGRTPGSTISSILQRSAFVEKANGGKL